MGRRGGRGRRNPRCTIDHELTNNRAATIVLEDVTLVIAAATVAWEHIELEAVGHTPCIDEGLEYRRKDAGGLDGSNSLQPLDAETSKAVVGPEPSGEAAVHDLEGVFLPRVLPNINMNINIHINI